MCKKRCGKEKVILFLVTERVSIFHVMRQKIPTILIVCSATVPCMH